MATHPFDTLRLNQGAEFIFTPCPGTKDTSVEEALGTLKSAGAQAIITVLPDDEIKKLAVESLTSSVKKQGMHWFHLPVEDDCEPGAPFFDAFNQSKAELLALVEKKATLAIHCRGGSGRTGLMAAILLLESGATWDDVKNAIQAIRPKALSLPVHLDFLRKYYSI